MKAPRVTDTEFQRSFQALSDRALREPVVITMGGRDSLVVMGVDEWDRLRLSDRRVGLAEELPEEWLEAVAKAEVPAEYAHLDDELK